MNKFMENPSAIPVAQSLTVPIADIEIPSSSRSYDATSVVRLAESIKAIGLQSALTVIERHGRFVLVAGLHRLEALKLLNIQSVLVRLVAFSDVEARMWTISENLHRAELTGIQRSEQVTEYARLAELQRQTPVHSAQVARNEATREDGRGHRREGGDSLTARDLGISREALRRAKTIAALPVQTKQAARDAGLDDNQSALLKAAKAKTPQAQVQVLHGIKDRGRVADSASRDRSEGCSRDRREDVRPVIAGPVETPGAKARPLQNLEGISGCEFARWIKITKPKDRPHVVRVLETAAAILQDELCAEGRGSGNTPLMAGRTTLSGP